MSQLGFGDLLASQPPLPIVDDFGPVGTGASSARFVRCENGSEYIVKGGSLSPGNRFVAANELIAVRLARYVGLPVLDHEVAELAGELVFASRWIDKGTFYPAITRDLLERCANKDRIYLLAVFDAWICNIDRHHENLVVRTVSVSAGGGELLLLNDHSHCLAVPQTTPADLPGKATSPVSGYYRLDFLREAVISRAGFEAALATVEGIDDQVIASIVGSVPGRILDPTDAGFYRELLVARRSLLRPLFLAEPDVFPNLT